jgi:hypothetical protein
MTFLAPLGLLALLTLPVIIILHFRRERLRRVAVPSLMLWEHLQPTTGKQRKMILPLTLLLLAHLAIAAALALALSQPQWLGELLGTGQQHIVVIVDTSTSMAARESLTATRLDQAQDHIRGLIDGLTGSDRLSLIAAGSQAQLLASGGGGNRAGLITALDELEAQGTGTAMLEAFTLAHVTRESVGDLTAAQGRIVVLSDMDPPLDATLPAEQIEWVRVGETTNNRAVVALAAHDRRGGLSGYDVYVRVTNYDDNPAYTTVRLFGDDELLNVRAVDLQANGEAELTWDLPPGIALLRAEIDSDDVLAADDVAQLSLGQSRTVNTVLVSEPSASLNALMRVLDAIPTITLSVVAPADYADVAQSQRPDLTIFNNALPAEWPAGGVLVINPPAGDHPLLTVAAGVAPATGEGGEAPAPTLELVFPDSNATSTLSMDDLNLESIDFDLNALPRIQVPEWARVQFAARPRSALPGAAETDMPQEFPLLLRGQTGESDIAIWAFDLSLGNLTSKLAFPLLVARSVEALTPPAPPESLLVGQALTVQPDPYATRVEITAPDDTTRQLVVSDTLVIEGLDQPGLYTLAEYADDDVLYEGQVAVNVGTPLESDLRPRALPVTEQPYSVPVAPENIADKRTSYKQPEPLWTWLALAALGLLTLEWLYVHWR